MGGASRSVGKVSEGSEQMSHGLAWVWKGPTLTPAVRINVSTSLNLEWPEISKSVLECLSQWTF